jgi:hypothetical protein
MNALENIEQKNALEIFTQEGVDPVLDAIKKEVESFEPDVSTATGRKEIASMAHKVAQSKTFLDGLGKDLVSEWKQKAKVVDSSRKKIREELDKLKSDVREPLTEWEQAEESRVKCHNDRLNEMIHLGHVDDLESSLIKLNISKLDSIVVDETWDEFEAEAHRVKAQVAFNLGESLAKREKIEAEQAELERLRKENEEREKREYEERIAREAAERARKEAEEKAKAERQKIEQQKLAAEKRAKELEEAKLREAQEAERKAKEAAGRAEREKLEAIEAEKRRAEDERLRKIEEERKRETDLVHRKKINNQALSALMEFSFISEDEAKKVVTAIASGQIPNIKIQY